MRVLLVDPVADLLPALQSALIGMQGVELYCAPDGNTAIQHASLLGGVDVLLTEVFLPGIDGFSVRDELQRQTPSLLTVFLTRHDLRAYADAIRGTPVLPIPVDPELVLSALQESRPAKAAATPPPTVAVARAIFTPPQKAAPVRPLPAAPQTPTLPEPAPKPSITPATPFPQAIEKPPKDAYAVTAPRSSSSEARKTAPTVLPYAALYPGASLGPYHIFGEDGSHPLGQNFAALHTSLNRPVHLVVMRPESAQDTEQTSAFLADARAKAKIHHPAILAVYEAGELEGRIFYAIERADGEPLESALLRGTKMDSDLIVKIARTTAECFLHLQEAQIPRLPLQLGDIRVLPDGNVRMQNVALGGLHPAVETPGEIALLGACLSKLLPPEAPASLRLNLQRTALEHPDRISGWEEWLALSNPVVSTAAPSKTENKTPTGSEQKPQQTRRFPLGLVLTLGMGAAVMGALFYGMKPESLTPAQALIPKDQYPVGTGRRAALDEFSLDSTEVTNRQYFKFMDWMREHPREGSRYDHPEQPPHHSHIPKGWEEMFPEKFRPEKDKTNPLLDLPVTQVSWWDAYAFAQWAGRILPTEEQWEAAGRGPRGLLFPWGDEPEPERTNVNRPGYVLKPGETSGPRGVATLNDASVFGVKGLSGNVSEWTSTRRDGRVVVKGGHYGAPLLTLDAASTISPDFRSANIGFRTASPASSTRP